MDQLQTPDGVFYVWDTQRDITDLCRKYISDDVADYVSAVLSDKKFEEEMAQMEFDSDFTTIEMENEELRNYLDDINSRLQQLSYKMDENPKMRKLDIQKEIDDIYLGINKIL